MDRNRVTRRNYSIVLFAKASLLRFDVNANGQRKVYNDDIQKPASNFYNLEEMFLTRSNAMQMGILIVMFPRTPSDSLLPMTYTSSLESLFTLMTCFIWPSTSLICS